MRVLKFMVVGLLLFFTVAAEAQVSVNISSGTPPQWGPAGHSDVRYYYLPDVEAYYDVSSSKFIYYNGTTWIHRSYLPRRYRNYDLYNGYKVVMTDYRGNTPYVHFKEYQLKYAKGYRGGPQKTYGQRPENGKSNHRKYTKSLNKQKVRKNNNQGNRHTNSKKRR